MSFNVTQLAVEGELHVLEKLLQSIPSGLDNLEYTCGECTGLILCLARLKLISLEQQEGCLNEVERLRDLGLEQREIQATRASLAAMQANLND
ncbi:hypothetical protein HDC30_002390 [Pseudomonas sp. JAI115]|uniref:hypothetical protein n=1 Tax=Pseudomonas sp. JAI115 TaxID=2723061 RepID=UPI001613DA81|nr:hypothetical protein [Pseudomonas sp. JAI115]MBB6155167.1 hypothetical protein [Pseudomonas sp. JAI115]